MGSLHAAAPADQTRISNSPLDRACAVKMRNPSGMLARRTGNPAYLRRLLLAAGDIESNPGPPRWRCGACGEPVKSSDKDWSIWCVDCRRWNHRRCLQMTVEEIKVLAKYRWHCGCKPSVAKTRRSQPAALPPILQTQQPSPATRKKVFELRN